MIPEAYMMCFENTNDRILLGEEGGVEEAGQGFGQEVTFESGLKGTVKPLIMCQAF